MASYNIPYKRLVKVSENLSDLIISGGGTVAAGYPAEAYNYIEEPIDLNKYILGEPRARSSSRKSGTDPVVNVWATKPAMTGDGISIGDLLVVNAAVPVRKGMLQLLWHDDEFTVRSVVRHEDHIELLSPNPDIRPIELHEGEELKSYGPLWRVIKKFSVYRDNYAGYPPDAENYVERGMDYTKYLINLWETTVYLWAGGDSMIGDGIRKGDLLIVDRLAEPHPDDIMVFVIDRQFTLKRVAKRRGYNELISSNPDIPPIRIKKGEELNRWGVLTGVVKKLI